jgi:hypothetical protein
VGVRRAARRLSSPLRRGGRRLPCGGGAWDLIGPELVRLGLERLSDVEADELTRLLARWSPPRADDVSRSDEVLRFSELSMRVFQVLATASANRWLRSTFDQLSDQMSRLWVTLLEDREVPEQLQQLMDRWDRHVAGRQPGEVAEHLPRLIPESGRVARDLFQRLPTTRTGPSDLATGWRTSTRPSAAAVRGPRPPASDPVRGATSASSGQRGARRRSACGRTACRRRTISSIGQHLGQSRLDHLGLRCTTWGHRRSSAARGPSGCPPRTTRSRLLGRQGLPRRTARAPRPPLPRRPRRALPRTGVPRRASGPRVTATQR